MQALYTIGIRIYYILLLLASAWNKKAAKWISGRRSWREKLNGVFSIDEEVIWFHCASLGEFEQGRPVIEMLRREHAQYKILITFFSPSGYEKRKNYEFADHVAYMPLDLRKNAKDFLTLVPVKKAFFIKYEFWPNFLLELNRKGIPLYLVSGHFRQSQLFFKWYGGWYRKMLGYFSHLFVQEETSKEILSGAGIKEVSVAGDTRFDRVIAIAEDQKRTYALNEFSSRKPTIIAGSTWEKDEELLYKAFDQLKSTVQLIIAPHEPGIKNINRLKSYFGKSILFSEIEMEEKIVAEVVFVDTIGHLSSLYQYADMAMIGGGFGRGIHNILEATAAGLPVLFGPNYKNFQEAKELIKLGSAHSIKSSADLIYWIDHYLKNKKQLDKEKQSVKEYTLSKTGASKFILEQIF